MFRRLLSSPFSPFLIYFTFNLALLNAGVGNAQNTTYKAAVFQYVDPSNSSKSHQDIMLESLLIYQQQISVAAEQGVDIIIFPEYGITGLSTPSTREEMIPLLQALPSVIADPNQLLNPCLQPWNYSFNTTILMGLSCAAKANNIIVVANVPTLVPCDPSQTESSCPTDGAYQFNTDVVFSQNGTVLTYYHKINLFLEPTFNTPPYPPDYVSTFATSYATFGLITCFDILFQHPLITMVTGKNVQNLLMPTAWYDGLPFLTSVQAQDAFAIGLNINVIAANIQKSSNGNRGTGIFSGSLGYVNYTFSTIDANLLIINDVPIVPGNAVPKISSPSNVNYDSYPGIIYDNLSNFSFFQIFANNSLNLMGTAFISNGNVSCFVSYQFDQVVDIGDYFVSAYDGLITYGSGTYTVYVQICSILWCENPNDPVQSCGRPAKTFPRATLQQLSIIAQLDTNYVYPNILRHDLQLIDKNEWSFSKSNSNNTINCLPKTESGKIIAEINTKDTFSEKILVGSLYARNYDRDPVEKQNLIKTII